MDPSPPASVDPAVVAGLLRGRIASGPQWLDATGRSMWPTIKPPARVLVTKAQRPRRGEIWAFVSSEGDIVVHRFERRVGAVLLFRGDGRRDYDRPVPAALILGRVVAAESHGRSRRFGLPSRLYGLGRSSMLRARTASRRLRTWVVRTRC